VIDVLLELNGSSARAVEKARVIGEGVSHGLEQIELSGLLDGEEQRLKIATRHIAEAKGVRNTLTHGALARPNRVVDRILKAQSDVSVASAIEARKHLEFDFVVAANLSNNILAQAPKQAFENWPDHRDGCGDFLGDRVDLSL
jgi:hypothetical protein